MGIWEYGMFIAGKWVQPTSGATQEILDPATNGTVAHVAAGTREDVQAAVEAARVAFESPDWGDLDPSKRGRLLWLLGQQIRDHFDELARIESVNVGKPIREAKGDIAYVYKLFEYYAGIADKIQGDTIPVPGPRLDYTLREPLGVTAHIAPWNYPLVLASRGVAPALAAGNTVILKPATLTPLTALKLAELAASAGFPPGVLNVLTGSGREVGEALARHPDVDSVTFTGSTDTGRQILQVTSQRIAPVTLELGGKNPQIVLPDAKIDKALRGVLVGAYQNSGQMCWAGSRLIVHADIAGGFLEKLQRHIGAMRLGPGLREDVQMGPLISKDHAANVLAAIEDGIHRGSRILAGGGRPKEPDLQEGNFVQPTLFSEPPAESRVAKEEVFGPVLCSWEFEHVDDAIARANDTPYGLCAGLWTQDVGQAHSIARRLKVGMVSINEFPVTFPQTPFLGWKESGLGQEQGLEAVRFYTRVKNVNVYLD